MDLLLLVSLITLLPLEKVKGDYVADEDILSCQGFAADKVIRDLISSGHATAEPCPCIEQIIAIDETFEKIDNCYKQWFFTDGIKQMCCYSDNGQLLLDSPGAGYLLLESNEGYIERAHDMCCGNGSDAFKESCESFYQINEPNDCSSYVPPVVSISSGDPVIQTIDGGKYDFNGHGEYVFLTDVKNFEIQARTEYVVKGNNDSTYFSAFALLDKTSQEQIELHYDREADDIRYIRNGSYNSNCSASSMLGHGRAFPCEGFGTHKCFVLAGGGKIIIHNCGFKSYIEQLVFGTDNFLSVQIIRDSKANITNITGLAGHREDGFYITRNITKVSENASALSLFLFAESWSLQNVSESVFMYKETGGNFTTYNTHHTRPEFLEDKLGNLTALFGHFTTDNITLFNKTCRNYWNKEHNNQCLLAIARTGDYNRGLDVMREANATRYKWEILHNKAPFVSPNRITVNINSTRTINLTDYVTDDNTPPERLVFEVVTNVTAEEYSIDNGVFTWNVGIGLREKNTSIKFIVFDKFNASSVFNFSINYCGCSEVSFCSFNDSTDNPTDTVVRASCKCPQYLSGLYCENIKDVCPNYQCYSDCNATFYRSKPSWPCHPCPKGREHSMSGYNQLCTDIDECKDGYSGADKCKQDCTNTDGSFKCSCFSGYELNRDGHSCDDIDECSRGIKICKKTEICVNTLGNSSCLCAPGYQRDDSNECKKIDGGSYAGSIEFEMIVPVEEKVENDSFKDTGSLIQKKLTYGFNGSSFLNVDVVGLTVIQNHKKYRLQATFIVHVQKKTPNGTAIKNMLLKSFQENYKTGNNVDLGRGISIYLRPINFKVLSKGLCTIPKRVECDVKSTDCEDTGGETRCRCKTGFKTVPNSNKFCEEINECMVKKNEMETDLCVNGKCKNTDGSWICVCDNHIYKHLHNTSDGDIQRYRCEGDYQYIGQLELFTSIEYNVNNTFWRKYLNNKITPLFSKRNREKINQNDGIPPMSDIFWKLDFLNSTKGSPHMFTILYVLHIGESVSTTWVNKFQDKVINESQNTKLGTVIVTIDKSTIIDESIFNLCNIDNKTQCDTETTSCEVHNGSYACPCKNGFSRQFNNPYQCQDINECQWKNMTDLCQRGQCINTEGSWDCICRNQKYSERYNKSLGVEMKRMRCEGEYQYIGNVSLKQGYNNTRSHVELELSNLFLKAPTDVNCSINDAAGEETAALYDIFKKLDIIEIANNENGNQDVLYVLHLGESVSIKCLNEKQQAIFTGNIGFVNASIVSESRFNICNVENLIKCDKETTSCEVINRAYTCPCKAGFFSTHSPYQCEDIDECVNQTCNNGGKCKNTFGNWTCSCLSGFESTYHGKNNITCDDIDECHRHDIYSCHGEKNSSLCSNTVGNWDCLCKNGFVARNITETVRRCEDSDECENDSYYCNGTCSNSVGNWTCTCPKGYTVQPNQNGSRVFCIDVDECEVKKFCSEHGKCVNTQGSFECNCYDGFELNVTNKKCIDINECQRYEIYSCHGQKNSSLCSNTVGTWDCLCTEGFVARNITDTVRSCDDIDECKHGSYYCNGSCSNSVGDWACTCPKGYTVHRNQNGSRVSCIDIDECKNDSYYCNGTCSNSVGDWTCTCSKGFTVKRNQNGSRVFCIDIDECEKPSICGNVGMCNNTKGTYICTCPKSGYVQNKYKNESCEDINECTNKSYHCGGKCNNTLGSWTCECEEGYSKESNNETKIVITCEDINECDKGAKCEEGVCINLDGSWSCDCPDGKQPERINSTTTVCRGGYQYIMSTGVSVPVSKGVKESEISIYMKAQIETIYAAKFQNQHVRVYIISVISVGSGKRRKRQASENYEINFVLHSNQSIPHEKISQAWTEYIKQNCSQNGCPAPKSVRELPVVIAHKINIAEDQSAALCRLDKFNHCNRDTSTCNFVNGSANCDCKKGYTNNGTHSNLTCEVKKEVCKQNPCENSATCRMTQDNKDFECVCRDGWTGKYCENAQISKTGETTILIATASSLGGVVIILTLTVMLVCRSKSKKVKEAEKMSLKHMDGSLFRNRYIDDDDGDGSFYSRRLSSSSLPYGHQNRVSGNVNQIDIVQNELSPMQYKLPRLNPYSSMPNLADNGINRFDDQRHSGDETRRMSSYNQDLNRSYDIDLRASRNSWNGRRSPPPDYGRPRSPKPDYLGGKLHRLSDNGVRNDNNSKRKEYSRQENRELHYLYQQRQSTNF